MSKEDIKKILKNSANKTSNDFIDDSIDTDI